MSKPGAKKAARQKRKRQMKEQKRLNSQIKQYTPTPASPSFPAERLGVPSALSGWIGRKVSTIFKLHR